MPRRPNAGKKDLNEIKRKNIAQARARGLQKKKEFLTEAQRKATENKGRNSRNANPIIEKSVSPILEEELQSPRLEPSPNVPDTGNEEEEGRTKTPEPERRDSSPVLGNSSDSLVVDLDKLFEWDKPEPMVLEGEYPLYSALLCVMRHTRPVSEATIQLGNEVHWQFDLERGITFLEKSLISFSYRGKTLSNSQAEYVGDIGIKVIRLWNQKGGVPKKLANWKGTDNMDFRLKRSFIIAMERVNEGANQPLVELALCGNLIRAGTTKAFHQQYKHMPEFHNWLLETLYSINIRTPVEYTLRANLLWECIFMGVAFPISLGINRGLLETDLRTPLFGTSVDYDEGLQLQYLALILPLLQLSLRWEEAVNKLK